VGSFVAHARNYAPHDLSFHTPSPRYCDNCAWFRIFQETRMRNHEDIYVQLGLLLCIPPLPILITFDMIQSVIMFLHEWDGSKPFVLPRLQGWNPNLQTILMLHQMTPGFWAAGVGENGQQLPLAMQVGASPAALGRCPRSAARQRVVSVSKKWLT
jgi:hypothetical protein